jgi:acyl-CoA reductase-like NAD-dependent aldehyde dehydrogenase
MTLTHSKPSVDRHGLLIGGERVTQTSQGFHPHVYPGDGAVNAEVAMASPADVDRAVESATLAQRTWAALPADVRRDLMLRLSDLVTAEVAELTRLSVQDNGVPLTISGVHPFQMGRWLRYYAGWIDKRTGQIPPVSFSEDLSLIREEPYGVVGVILPWNGPMPMIGMAVAPALAAGNAVVIKPPELAPLSSLRFGELALAAGLPEGLVNVLPGDHVAGEALVRHPGVSKIHFTGSGDTARKIYAAALDNLTPVATELGGKSAHIVFDDADLDTAIVLASFSGPLAQSGQNCACGSRIFVQRGVYDQFVEKMAGYLGGVAAGDPMSADTVLGPVISESALQRILGVVDTARAAGAEVVTGGRRIGGRFGSGFYLEPTLIAGAAQDSALNQVETFGPVVSVTPFTDEDEVVGWADGTDFGLVSYLQTHDLQRAHRVAGALQSGTVFVNTFPDLVPSAPYGGFKRSGDGRLGGLEGLREFSQVKNVRIALAPPTLPS